MIYGFSLLFVLLGLVLILPALRKLAFMRDVNKNKGVTTGSVISTKSAMGWMWVVSFGNQDRPLIRYESPTGTELILEVTTSSVLPMRRYENGETVEVVYDREHPGRAYAVRERKFALDDLWAGGVALVVAIALWVVGRMYSMPF